MDRTCSNCTARGICGGGCLLDAFLQHGTISAADSRMCALAQELLAMIVKEIGQHAELTPFRVLSIDEKTSLLGSFLSSRAKPLRVNSDFGRAKL